MKKATLILVLFPLFLSAQINKDSLWTIWSDQANPDTIRLQAIKGLVQYGYLFSQPDTAFIIAQNMYDLAEEKDRQLWMVDAANYQGISLAIRGRNHEAIKYFSECLEINKRLNNKHRIAGSLNNIGNLYELIDDFEKAAEYYKKSLAIYEEIDDLNGQALTLGNISSLQNQLGNTEASIPLTQRSLELFEELGDTKGIGNSYSALGTIYGSLGDTTKIQGDLALAKDYYLKAFEYYQKALPIRKKAGDKDGIAVTLHGMGMLQNQLGNTGQAVKYVEEAHQIALEIGSPTSIRNTTSELHNLYKKQGKTTQALEMLEQFIEANEQVLSDENQRAVIKQEYEFAYQQQAFADSISQAEEALKVELAYQTELREKDQLRDLLVLLFVIGILVSVGLWSRNRYINATNKELAIAKERAEQSEKFKEQFLANMSHEIRTPMHAISGMVNILKRKKHPKHQEPYLQAMQTSSENLIVILNDILDLSKIEAGQLPIEQIPTAPKEIVENATQFFQFKAKEKGLKLSHEIDAELPDLIMGDPTRLNQILNNLISNAIKFTEKGQVKISLQKLDNQYQIQVKDSGIGIAPDKLNQIFGEFEQADSSISQQYGGTGLGLSITKQLVELQKGKIWVESQPGQGSTFFVRLPLMEITTETGEDKVGAAENIAAMAGALKGIRILIADDNVFNQMIAQDDLEHHIQEVQITKVETGTQALEQFQQAEYDLILMDVQMPEMDGLEATEKIRTIESGSNRPRPIPIIAMTASLLKTEIAKCYQAGATSYIPKPYQIKELIGEIYKGHFSEN